MQSPRRETAVQGGDAYIEDELGLFRWDRSRRMERADASSDLDGQSPHRPCRKCGYGWFQREPGVAQYAGSGCHYPAHDGDTRPYVVGTPREMNLITWSGLWPGQKACIAHVDPTSFRSESETPGWAARATSNPSSEPRS